jgi:hypothetical protein
LEEGTIDIIFLNQEGGAMMILGIESHIILRRAVR